MPTSFNHKCRILWCNLMKVPCSTIKCSTSLQLIRCSHSLTPNSTSSKWWWCTLIQPLPNIHRINLTMLTTSLPILSTPSLCLCSHTSSRWCKTKPSNSSNLISMETQCTTTLSKIPNRQSTQVITPLMRITRPLMPKNRPSEHNQKNNEHSWIR